MVIGPEATSDPDLILHSIADGTRGPNLLSLLLDARQAALAWLASNIRLLDDGLKDAERAYSIPIELDVSAFPYDHLVRPFGLIRISRMRFGLTATVGQTRFEHDRGKDLHFALAVENYVTRQRSVVARRDGAEAIAVHDLGMSGSEDMEAQEEVLENGILLQIFFEPWVELGQIKSQLRQTPALTYVLPDRELRIEGSTEGLFT